MTKNLNNYIPFFIRLLAKLHLVRKIDDFCADLLINFEGHIGDMAEKFSNKDAKNGNFNNQVKFCKKSIHRELKKFSIFIAVALTAIGCSSQEEPQAQMLSKGEFIYRTHDEHHFILPALQPTPRDKYPWEDNYIGLHPRITKEFFRCKGNLHNPVQTTPINGKEPLRFFDCGGAERHGLPLVDGKEYVYPSLLELLNYIQAQTDKKVVITSGHRCPQHEAYCCFPKPNFSSKHMIGAEVDFYVQGYENNPLDILQIIINYYKESSHFKGLKEYEEFQRYEKNDLDVSTQPWHNKEIFIKLYKAHEGRNFDNRHPYPYFSIQVRYDKKSQSRVLFDQKRAQNFLRY